MPDTCRIAGLALVIIAACLLSSTSAANAGSRNVSFSGYVPCRLAVQNCGASAEEEIASVQTASVEYHVSNTGGTGKTLRPVVRGGTVISIYPATRDLAPGETARFLVLVGLSDGKSKVEICSADGAGRVEGCRRFALVSSN